MSTRAIEGMYNLDPTELEEIMNESNKLDLNKLMLDRRIDASKIPKDAIVSISTIRPLSSLDSTYRTGGLINLTASDITAVLGFPPNVEDDPFKVVNSWAFMVNGEPAAIWDYKGSHKHKAWSIYDPSGVVVGLFGAKHYEKGGW